MAGISKAERERRAAEAAAAAASQTQGSEGTGTDMEPAADGAAITGDGSGNQLPPVDGDDLADKLQEAGPDLVHMTRDASAHPAPHTAEVHPDEVGNYAAGGWQLASD